MGLPCPIPCRDREPGLQASWMGQQEQGGLNWPEETDNHRDLQGCNFTSTHTCAMTEAGLEGHTSPELETKVE